MHAFTPSPVAPTDDQADTIRRLTKYGARPDINVTVDAGALDETAHAACDNDAAHGPATVCTKDGHLCVSCTEGWMRWHPGEQVALEILRTAVAAVAAA